MEEIALFGRYISIGIIVLLYVCGWMPVIVFLRGENDGIGIKTWSVIWSTIHVLALFLFMLWSWFN